MIRHPVLDGDVSKEAFIGGVKLPGSIKSNDTDHKTRTVWDRIAKIEKKELCLNCERHRWKNKDLQVCADCYKLCETKKCIHCKTEFSSHKFCKKAESIYRKCVCMRCASNIATFNTDPRLCKHCNTWAAWRSTSECDRCFSLLVAFGAPSTCESCGNVAAFDRGEASRNKVGGLRLCFLCTYDYKKNNYYSKKRHKLSITTDKSASTEHLYDVGKLKSPDDSYKQELEVKSKLLQEALAEIEELRGSLGSLKKKYDDLLDENGKLREELVRLKGTVIV